MPADRLRWTILVEDKLTERLLRHLLLELGQESHDLYFQIAPFGQGAAEAWVLKRYPTEVKVLRSKNYQPSLRLIAVRDGDTQGFTTRKQQFDQKLIDEKMDARLDSERIATMVPTRNIETWLLALLGMADVDETTDYKQRFPRESKDLSNNVFPDAAKAWRTDAGASLESLQDGRRELDALLT